jgi:hypothetical protein
MLNLTKDGEVVKTVPAGAQFTLPNGDIVSPAYEGWSDGEYTLVEAPIEPEPEPLPPTREQQEANRRASYNFEGDPIFFMAQRGEATMEEWQAKVEEIKTRFPYPAV